jgi:hemolysin activation/secretion protein
LFYCNNVLATANISAVLKDDNKTNLYAQLKDIKVIKAAHGNSSIETTNTHVVNIKPFLVKSISVYVGDKQEDLTAITDEYQDAIITKEKFIELERKLVRHYIKKNYLLPIINVLEANKNNKGVLSLKIKLNSFANVVFKGDAQQSKLIQQYANKIVEQKPALVTTTQHYLALISRVPGYEVTYKLDEKGSRIEDQTIELVLNCTKDKVSNFIGLDNYGSKSLGKYQVAAVSQWFSPFRQDESITLNVSTTNHTNRMGDIGISYIQPLNAQGTSSYLAYSSAVDNYTKSQSITAPNNSGSTFRANLNHELYLTTRENVSVKVGVTYKDRKAYLVSNNTPQLDKKSEYWVGDIGIKYLVNDNYGGRTLSRLKYLNGLGGKYRDYQGTKNIKQRFQLYKLSITREQEIINDFSMFANFNAGYSCDVLPDAYKFSIGGRDFGRGYDSGAISGYSMVGLLVEARYTKHIGNQYIKHIQPYAFYDVGYVGSKYSGASVKTLQSAGPGLRFKMEHHIEFGAEIGAPINKSYTVNGSKVRPKTKLNVFINKAIDF